MSEKDRITGLAALLSEYENASEVVNSLRCGGKKYGSGGRTINDVLTDGARKVYYNYDEDAVTGNGERYYDIVKSRYDGAMSALRRNGFAYDDALRLAPMIVTQNILEGGWVLNRPDNNFGGMRQNGKTMSFDTVDDFYDTYLQMLDHKWGGPEGSMNNWRNARNLDDWARILNHEDLHLWSKERFTDYNRQHRDNPVYLYAPEWENNNKSYRQHLGGVEYRTKDYLNRIFDTTSYTPWEMPEVYPDVVPGNYSGGGTGGGMRASGGKIRIKPENRGKFTALKKRTGHSASWFKAHGTPAQKKMAVFALNARKWKHGDGGLLNTFEEGGEEERIPWWRYPVRVPNMTGTATAAAAGLRDIPLSDSTVGKELGVAATGLASIAGPAAINWLANPANQILTGKFAVPMVGAGAFDQAVKNYTPYSSWGDAIVSGTGLGEVMDYALLPRAQQDLVRTGAEFTNPAFFAPYSGMARGIDKVASRYADDFGKYVVDPVKRNVQYMKDWYDFVGRKNTKPFADALNSVDALRLREEGLKSDISGLERGLMGYPKYELSVYPKTENISLTSGGIYGMPTAGTYDSPLLGPVDTPFVVENIGLPGNQTMSYLSRSGSGVPYTFEFYPRTVGRGKIYEDAYIGKPNMFTSKLSDHTFHTPESVLESPVHIGNFLRSGHSVDPIRKYDVTGSGGKFLPVSRADARQAEMYGKIVDDIEGKLAGRGTTMGSLRLYKDGMLTGSAHDTEMIVPWEYLDDVKKDFQFVDVMGDNGFALNGNSPLVPQLGKQGGKGNLEIHPIRINAKGEATGDVAWGMFKTMHPEEFASQAESSIGLRTPYSEMSIINPSTGKPYTSLELYQEFVNGNYQSQHVVNEALGLNKNYMTGRGIPGTSEGVARLMKQNRPMSILTNPDPEVKAMVRTALDTNGKASVGYGYRHGSDYFPNIDFSDVEGNKKFLRSLGIGDEKIASDPEMMKNFFDAWFMPRTTRARFVSWMRNKAATETAIFENNMPFNGMNSAGSGNNTVRASYNNNPIGADQGGSWQVFPSYRESMPDVHSLGDIQKIFARTEQDYVFTAEEEKIINKVFRDELEDLAVFPHTDAITRRAASDLLSEIKRTPIKGINRLDQLFKKSSSPIGRMERDLAQDLIQSVSEAADIPEIGTLGYSKYYQGVWNKNKPKSFSMRQVNTMMDRQPFEVGRDLWRYAQELQPGADVFDPAALSKEDRYIYDVFDATDLHYGGVPKAALDAAGATQVLPEQEVKALRGKLQEVLENSESSEQLYGLLRRYKNMPFSRKVVRDTEKELGLHYRKERSPYYSEQVLRTEPRINGRSRSSVIRDISSGAPEEVSINDIIDVNWNDASKTYNVMDGDHVQWSVSKKDGKWVWELELPFAAGGYLNRMKSIYGNDTELIRQVIMNARTKNKK